MTRAPHAVPETVLRGRAVTPTGMLDDGAVAFSGGRISWVGRADTIPSDAGWPAAQSIGSLLLPGLVDLHCHGAAGHSFPDADAAGGRVAARHHHGAGTTMLLASLVTADEPLLLSALAAAADLVEDGTVAGIHLEGPYLSENRCGAQDPAFMRNPTRGLTERLLAAGRGGVVSMTYAAELPGADALVDELAAQGVLPSLGHTDASATVAAASLRRAARLGRVSVTHLFNGMRPLHHRDPGPVAASLAAAARGDAVLELVADGVHLADETVATVFELVGPGAVALVTDAMAATGMPDGSYRLGPADVGVEGGVARLASGAIAGGTATLLDVVRRCVQRAGLGLADVVQAASTTPAALLGLADELGSLAVGHRADVLAVDDDLQPVAVWRAGTRLPAPAGGTTR